MQVKIIRNDKNIKAFSERGWRALCRELTVNASKKGDFDYRRYVELFSDSVENLVFSLPEECWGKAFRIAKEFGYETPSCRANGSDSDESHICIVVAINERTAVNA